MIRLLTHPFWILAGGLSAAAICILAIAAIPQVYVFSSTIPAATTALWVIFFAGFSFTLGLAALLICTGTLLLLRRAVYG